MKKLEVIVAGSRDFTDFKRLETELNKIVGMEWYESKSKAIELISGGCRGTDLLGEKWAKNLGFPIKRFPADWNLYGKAAGPIRNHEMAIYAASQPDSVGILVAFWNGKSRGTKNMIDEAKKVGLKVIIVNI